MEILLSQKDIIVNSQNLFGCAPLHHEAQSNCIKYVELILTYPDITVKATDNYDSSPLQ